MKKRIKIKSWMGIFGLAGFMGLLAFPFKEPAFLALFSLFGYFSYYWEGKLANEIQDERLTENRQRAQRIVMPAGFALVFAGMILIGGRLASTDPARAYGLLSALIAFTFAVSLNLSAYLTCRFDKGE